MPGQDQNQQFLDTSTINETAKWYELNIFSTNIQSFTKNLDEFHYENRKILGQLSQSLDHYSLASMLADGIGGASPGSSADLNPELGLFHGLM